MDMDFTAKADKSFSVNVKFFKIMINGETVCNSSQATIPEDIEFHNGDEVKVCGIIKKRTSTPGKICLVGFTTDDVVSENDSPEEQYIEDITIEE